MDGRGVRAIRQRALVAYIRRGEKNGFSDLVFIHDRLTGKTTELNTLPGWTFAPTVWGVRFSPDGQEALITGQSTTGAGDGAVSVWKAGGPITQVTGGQYWSFGIGVSDNGSHVAFLSEDPTLVPGDTNHADDVFLRDLATGTTQRIDLTSTRAQIPDGVDLGIPIAGTPGAVASLSGDGRYVAFDSADPTVVPGDTNNTIDVFLLGPLS